MATAAVVSEAKECISWALSYFPTLWQISDRLLGKTLEEHPEHIVNLTNVPPAEVYAIAQGLHGKLSKISSDFDRQFSLLKNNISTITPLVGSSINNLDEYLGTYQKLRKSLCDLQGIKYFIQQGIPLCPADPSQSAEVHSWWAEARLQYDTRTEYLNSLASELISLNAAAHKTPPPPLPYLPHHSAVPLPESEKITEIAASLLQAYNESALNYLKKSEETQLESLALNLLELEETALHLSLAQRYNGLRAARKKPGLHELAGRVSQQFRGSTS